MNVTTVYLVILSVSLIYALFVGLAGDLAGGDADIDVSGLHGDVPDGDGLHFNFFSPTVIACFAAAFGASGVVTKEAFHLPLTMQIPISLGAGLCVGFLMMYLLAKLKSMSSASGEVAKVDDLVGEEAVVTVEISPEGFGEIAYEARGSRFTAPAQSEEKTIIEKGAIVNITRTVGTTFFVEKRKNGSQ